MSKKYLFFILIYVLSGFFQISEAGYSLKVIVKYPFTSEHFGYDSLGNPTLISDSLVRCRPIKVIIFQTEKDSLYQEGVTNDSGFTNFIFDEGQKGVRS
jgi:hypothetical protein